VPDPIDIVDTLGPVRQTKSRAEERPPWAFSGRGVRAGAAPGIAFHPPAEIQRTSSVPRKIHPAGFLRGQDMARQCLSGHRRPAVCASSAPPCRTRSEMHFQVFSRFRRVPFVYAVKWARRFRIVGAAGSGQTNHRLETGLPSRVSPPRFAVPRIAASTDAAKAPWTAPFCNGTSAASYPSPVASNTALPRAARDRRGRSLANCQRMRARRAVDQGNFFQAWAHPGVRIDSFPHPVR